MLRFVSRKAFVIPTVALAALAMLPAVSHAGTKGGDWILQLAGDGSNEKSFRAGAYGADVTIGYFITDAAEVSVQQVAAYAYANNGKKAPIAVGIGAGAGNGNDVFVGATQLAFDWNFALGNFVPFVGANCGVSYGTKSTPTTWEAGPEGGIKVFLNQTTYIYAEVQWDIFLNHVKANGDNGFLYGIGLGVKL